MSELNKKSLEAAAEALHNFWCPTCDPYKHVDTAHRQYCEDSARAAVKAYLATECKQGRAMMPRIPTSKMVETARKNEDGSVDYYEIWIEMFDALEKEERNE